MKPHTHTHTHTHTYTHTHTHTHIQQNNKKTTKNHKKVIICKPSKNIGSHRHSLYIRHSGGTSVNSAVCREGRFETRFTGSAFERFD